MLVCLLSMLALLAGALRAPSIDSGRLQPLSLETPDARSGESDPAITQHGELCRVPGVRPSGGPPSGGPQRTSALLLRALAPGSSITRRFSECRIVHDDSELYVWARRAPTRAELMVFLN